MFKQFRELPRDGRGNINTKAIPNVMAFHTVMTFKFTFLVTNLSTDLVIFLPAEAHISELHISINGSLVITLSTVMYVYMMDCRR